MRCAVLWDLDGVLVDSTEAHFDAWRRLAESRGRALGRHEFLRTFGMTNPDAIRVLFGEVPASEAAAMAAWKEIEFRRLLRGRAKALPGAVALALALSDAGHAQAIASSAPLENVRAVLDELELGDRFDAIASGDDIQRGKPDPQIFLLAAQRLGAPPRECVVLEDADVGVAAAKRAGMRVYAVTTSRKREELAAADRVVDRLDELRVSDFAC